MMSYAEDEVRRIAHVGFRAAQGRGKQAVLGRQGQRARNPQLWRDVVIEVAAEYPDVELSHMYVDNAAMQLVRDPGQFDVIVTGNLFGDILSDQASMCVGSIGLLASASLGASRRRHRASTSRSTAARPTSPGKGKANPLATILSAAMLLRHSLRPRSRSRRGSRRRWPQALADGVRGARPRRQRRHRGNRRCGGCAAVTNAC